MKIDAYRRARINKDKSFDGQFYFGVETTGIFCRPSCPSPQAKEENVIYFDTVFQALERGFRPCLRCRPDIEIPYDQTNVEGVLIVQRALQMIYDGFLNRNSLEALAAALYISSRQLRQLFVENLGLPPIKIAKYHKVLFAKKLLLYSSLELNHIIEASGFNSSRQFNATFKDVLGVTPSEMRKRGEEILKEIKHPVFLLPYKKPFNFSQMIEFMRLRQLSGVEPINQLFIEDSYLSKGMIEGHVPRLPVAFNTFEFVIRAILGQQVSVKAATTFAGRVAKASGIETPEYYPEGLNYFFPTVEEFQGISLESVGLTKTRQQTIWSVVKALLNDEFSLSPHQSLEQFQKEFSAVKGIGDWTVHYVAMRGLGMVDSFPAMDLGVLLALQEGESKPKKKEVLKRAELWRPYRAYAALCLWASLVEDAL